VLVVEILSLRITLTFLKYKLKHTVCSVQSFPCKQYYATDVNILSRFTLTFYSYFY